MQFNPASDVISAGVNCGAIISSAHKLERTARTHRGCRMEQDCRRLVRQEGQDLQLGDGGPVGFPLTGHVECIGSISWAPDGKRLASGSDNRTVCIWENAASKELSQQGHSRDNEECTCTHDSLWHGQYKADPERMYVYVCMYVCIYIYVCIYQHSSYEKTGMTNRWLQNT